MSLTIKKKVILNTNNDKPNSRIIIKKGSINTIILEVLLNDKGGVMDLPNGTTAKVRMLKPDKKQVLNDCTISNNIINVEVTEQMQVAVGEGLCEVVLFYNGKTLTSATFPIIIEPNVHDESDIESTQEYNSLVNALIKIEEAVPKAEEAYTIAQQAKTFIEDLHDRVESGEFKGEKGDKGAKGNKGDKGDPFVYEDFTPEQLLNLKGAKGDKGDKGDAGTSPTVTVNINTGTTYTLDITDVNGTITTPNLKGADGTGAGDMTSDVYDPQGKAVDVFQYADNIGQGKLDIAGDTKDNITTFTEAEEDVDIVTGEKHSTIFGKLLKSIKTLRYNIGVLTSEKIDKSSIVNTDTINDTTKVPSTAVTHSLGLEIDTLTNNLADEVITSSFVAASGVTVLSGVVNRTHKTVTASFLLDLGANFPSTNTVVMSVSKYRPRNSVNVAGVAYSSPTDPKACLVTINNVGGILVQGFTGRFLAFAATYLT